MIPLKHPKLNPKVPPTPILHHPSISSCLASCKLKCLPDWPPWETAYNNEVIMVLCIVLLWKFLTIYIFKSAIPPNLGNMDKDYFHFLLKEI